MSCLTEAGYLDSTSDLFSLSEYSQSAGQDGSSLLKPTDCSSQRYRTHARAVTPRTAQVQALPYKAQPGAQDKDLEGGA